MLAVGSLAVAVPGLAVYGFGTADVLGYPIAGVVGSAVLVGCAVLILLGWLLAIRRLRSGGAFVEPGWQRVVLVAHVVSYLATLVAMFGALAASAFAGWDSPSGVLFGIAFLLVIFGQILVGTQVLRTTGPPATVPTYLRRLNALVQSKR